MSTGSTVRVGSTTVVSAVEYLARKAARSASLASCSKYASAEVRPSTAVVSSPAVD